MATPEGAVKNKIKRWFESVCAWSFAPVSNGMGAHGIPDRVGCVPLLITQEMVGKTLGVFVAIEAKAPGKKSTVTPLQRMQLDAIAAAGGISAVVDSEEDLVAVNAALTLKGVR